MSKVDEAIVELEAAQADLQLPLEGIQDFLRLNVGTETSTRVNQARTQYNRREQRIMNAINALNALVEDGYPVLEIPEVSTSVIEDLQAQHESITAALARFKSEPAASLGLTGGDPEDKDRP